MALRKSNTHLWPFPMGVDGFDVQRDGLHPTACRKEHKETKRPSANPRGTGCYEVLHPRPWFLSQRQLGFKRMYKSNPLVCLIERPHLP